MKGLRVAKGVRGVEFEGVWGELRSGAGFRGQWLAGCLEVALFFVWGGGGGAGGWAIILWGLDNFLIFPNFLIS